MFGHLPRRPSEEYSGSDERSVNGNVSDSCPAAATAYRIGSKVFGRALASAGWGSGLGERALGEAAGAETHQLTIDELPLHGHPYRAALTNQDTASSNTSGGFLHSLAGNSTRGPYTGTPTGSIGVGGAGRDQPHPIVQPTTFVHFMVKL